MKVREVALLLVAAVAGCARERSHVVPVSAEMTDRNPSKLICVVENRQVAVGGFLPAYRAALERKGYKVQIVPRNPQASTCPLSSRYVAYDNGFVELNLYWEGKPIGHAMHNSAARSEDALNQLVNRLLP